MSDFLLELRSEEIPARMQAGARAELERLFRRELDAAGILRQAQDERALDITVWSTPRRLALIARGLPEATQAVSEEAKGPPEGAPDAALDGYCRKNGVTRDQLTLRDVKGRATWFAVINKPGRATRDVLAEAIPAIIRDLAWPKSMRWGAASLSTESPRWVRPLSGIVALLGGDIVHFSVAGIASGAETLGHRFHHPGPITIGGADDYAEKLRACHVIVDHQEREALIREGAARVAAEAELTLIADDGLVVENAGLTEWPVPLLGRFDEAFLEVPAEVIQLTARVNQKYFVCENAGGALANAFVCTANIAASDGGAAIIDGNRKVLAARLSDARFFWEQDRKKTLAEHAEGLARITFHEKLGTVADKAQRVAKLARWLVEEGIVGGSSLSSATIPARPELVEGREGAALHDASASSAQAGVSRAQFADMAEQAALLCKADLVTEMVGEFPELQGLMGGYYARAEGLPDAVADAIRDHYKPVGQGDEVPTAPVTVAVSLADKLDTLVGFFLVGEQPTGSKDPFALRRAVIAVLRLLSENRLRFTMQSAIYQAARWLIDQSPGDDEYAVHFLIYARDFEWSARMIMEAEDIADNIAARGRMGYARTNWYLGLASLPNFFADRLKVQQREAGVRHDLIDAVFALGGEDDLVRLLARVHALQAFMATGDGANLLAGYKRAANILKKEGGAASTPNEKPLSYTPEPEEKALIDALDAAEPQARAAVEAEDFAAAMAALASLRAPIDRFFDSVTVNDPEPAKRAARLALLARLRDAVHQVADFSRIEG
ncbi:glycine--tRNA ligase subunit beta [Qipengyuania sp. YIM B01966]|uniref:glycine--tRNA ligase subunit beta n=1 Tax=Qipengyuania sp. YIM B01966 TaxID=2778646 RepID=UPI0018F4CD22|nr:glycine--tRNA ligase subunit beta [Qipengyuania sp. YIM B01966]